MSRMKTLGLMTAMLALSSVGLTTGKQYLEPDDIDVTPKTKPTPKGCKRYYFTKHGECYEGQHEIYFDALSKKNAYKKFERWRLNAAGV